LAPNRLSLLVIQFISDNHRTTLMLMLPGVFHGDTLNHVTCGQSFSQFIE